MSIPNSPWPGIIKLLLAWESLVSEVLAGDGKTANFFYSEGSRDTGFCIAATYQKSNNLLNTKVVNTVTREQINFGRIDYSIPNITAVENSLIAV
jgi:hypothetical protein